MNTTLIIILVVAAIVVVALVAVAVVASRRRALRQRFGPEYDRAVAQQESRSAAERELRERERRHAELDLKPLSPQSRTKYAEQWAQVQARFVDSPEDAVRAGDDLVTRLLHEIGYPTENYEDRFATLSVEHAATLGHYRDAHDIFLRTERGEASTEELRQALVHYRALFTELLGGDPVPPAQSDAATASAERPAEPAAAAEAAPETGESAAETGEAAAPTAESREAPAPTDGRTDRPTSQQPHYR